MTPGAKKSPASPSAGAVGSYIHADGRIGVLVEVGCESEFVARTEEFRELMHDLAMQIAASNPKFIRREDVIPEVYERERKIHYSQAVATGKPPQVVEKIVKGKMARFFEEVCLNEQPFIKDQTISISQLIAAKADQLGEKIAVRRFSRFKVEDSLARTIDNRGRGQEGPDDAGVPVKKPKSPKSGSGFAAADFEEESD